MGHKRKHVKLQVILWQSHCDCPQTRSTALNFIEFIFIKCLPAELCVTFIFTFYVSGSWMFLWRTEIRLNWEATGAKQGSKIHLSQGPKSSWEPTEGSGGFGGHCSMCCRTQYIPPRGIPITQPGEVVGLVKPDFLIF